MLFAEAVTVIQVEWQALTAFGATLVGGLLGAAKIIAVQMKDNATTVTQRHTENRADATEAREENRTLSRSIMSIQSETVKTMVGMQREIMRMTEKMEPGSKQYRPLKEGDG